MFEPSRSALLLLDFQNYGLHPDGYWGRQGIPGFPSSTYPAVEKTAEALSAARTKDLLIVHIGAAWREGSPDMNMNIPVFARGPDRSVEATWDADFYEPVKPQKDEIVIMKRSVSALAGTELDRLLRVRDINTLILTGIVTNFAVEGTAREAVDLGYRVIVLEDGCASATEEMHRFSVEVVLAELCTVSSVNEFIETLVA